MTKTIDQLRKEHDKPLIDENEVIAAVDKFQRDFMAAGEELFGEALGNGHLMRYSRHDHEAKAFDVVCLRRELDPDAIGTMIHRFIKAGEATEAVGEVRDGHGSPLATLAAFLIGVEVGQRRSDLANARDQLS